MIISLLPGASERVTPVFDAASISPLISSAREMATPRCSRMSTAMRSRYATWRSSNTTVIFDHVSPGGTRGAWSRLRMRKIVPRPSVRHDAQKLLFADDHAIAFEADLEPSLVDVLDHHILERLVVHDRRNHIAGPG